MSTAVSSSVDAATSSVVGESSTEATVTVTVAVLLSELTETPLSVVPSSILYVKASVPFQSESGVYLIILPLASLAVLSVPSKC